MNDVPIMILFCTKIQQKSLIDTIMEDRDRQMAADEKKDIFEYKPMPDYGGSYRNVHATVDDFDRQE